MGLYKKWTAKPYVISVIDTSSSAGNSLLFRKNTLKIYIETMILKDNIKNEKLQQYISK